MIRMICTTEQLEEVQKIAFSNNVTWPGGSTNIQIPMGSTHYVFIDKEFIWTESADTYKVKEVYKEVYADDYINNNIRFEESNDTSEPIPEDTVYEMSDGWETFSKYELVETLLDGGILEPSNYLDYHIRYIEDNKGCPFVLVTEGGSKLPIPEDVWECTTFRNYTAPKKMTLKEIEEQLGYKIEIVQ